MPPLSQVTPVVLTRDEEPNIGRCLDRLRWADLVVVVDSGSTDATPEIVESFSNTHLVSREFDSHWSQWNFGLEQVETGWTLALDADYLVPEPFVRELANVPEEAPENGYYARFDYMVLGRRLRRTLYPRRQVLVRTDRARFHDDGHTQRVRVDGPSGELDTPLVHDDRKPLSRWLRNQGEYARREAEKLESTPWRELSLPDRLRRTRVVGPPAVLLYCLFAKGLILKGGAGWYYTLERTVAECAISLALLRWSED